MVNGHRDIFVERGGRVFRWERGFENRQKLEDVIQQIVARVNRCESAFKNVVLPEPVPPDMKIL